MTKKNLMVLTWLAALAAFWLLALTYGAVLGVQEAAKSNEALAYGLAFGYLVVSLTAGMAIGKAVVRQVRQPHFGDTARARRQLEDDDSWHVVG